jgi:thioredoxin:protein disulfide reductase
MPVASKSWLFVALILVLMAGWSGVAAQEAPAEIVRIITPAQVPSIMVGETATLTLGLEIVHPWHINADKPNDEFLIPTRLKLPQVPGLTFGKVTYPQPGKLEASFSEEPLLVFEGNITVSFPVTATRAAAPGLNTAEATFTYQACDHKSCLPPKTISVRLAIEVPDGEGVAAAEVEPGPVEDVAPPASPAGGPDRLEVGGLIERYGYFWAFLAIFLGGLALNLTPCVYPVIPITLSFFSSQARQRKGGTFVLALMYVLGIALMYSTLGTVAALTGQIWGSALQSPWVLGFVALVMVALAFSMFGFYEITVPSALSARIGSRRGYVGALFMGLVVGVVAAPCVGPVIIGLLTFVSATGDPFLGFSMFFTLSLGLGLPYLLLGTFSGWATKLPTAGQWMETIKHIFGMILLGLAFYFLSPVIPGRIYQIVLPAYVAACGSYLLLGRRAVAGAGRGMKVTVRVLGVLTIALAVWLMLPQQTPGWTPYTEAAFEAALTSGRPIMIDVTAAWCVACRELDHNTFSDPRVIRASARFHRFKKDLTRNTPENVKFQEDFAIKGLPTVLFFDADGREQENLRVTEFIGPDRFMQVLSRVP